MWISRTFLLLILYSIMGWAYETIFCTLKDRKWENRGFLYGPICPIYGFGALAAVFVVNCVSCVSPLDDLPLWGVYLMSVFGSAVLEYVTSWTLEKLFHAVWWDYADMPFNLHGRISLFTSCGFGVAGVLIVYAIAPATENWVDQIPPLWTEALSLVCMGIFAADLTLTVSALTDLANIVEQWEQTVNGRMETLVDTAQQKTVEAKDRFALEQARLSRRLDGISKIRQMAFQRVRSLRYPKIEEARLNSLFSRLKNAIRSRWKK